MIIEILLEWPDYKKFLDGTTKSLIGQYNETSKTYELFAFDSSIRYYSTIYKSSFEPTGWTAQQVTDNDSWRTDFLNNFSSTQNQRVSYELTTEERSNWELETAFMASKATNFTKLTYSAGALTTIEIFEDDTETVKLFQKDLTYASGALSQVVITRISDSATLTKTFAYSSGTLSDITRS